MVSNAARKYQQEEVYVQQQSVSTGSERVGLNAFEKTLYSLGAFATVLLLIVMISTKISINTAQHNLQDLQGQVAQTKNDNASQQQEISDLTSESHLKSVANKYGLSDKNSNVRNINR
ncbi:MAG: cell division protein FtsL [Limosilactobacillus sp.]|uniref:cell division protein FtsL n=1 Tax=Limosilactobacillus sp. TaxID=2773925 RepID=UPI002707AAAB|nr:cell division protein FtsL [Limosilactobacillus sp.]